MSVASEVFSPSVYQARLDRAQQCAAEQGIDAIVVGTGADFAYLTGSWLSSHERLTALVIPADGQVCLVAPGTDSVDLQASPVPDLNVEIVGWNDGDNAHQLAVGELEGARRVALGASLTADHVLKLQELLAGSTFVLANTALSELFTRKDAAEIDQLDAAAKAIDAVHARVPELLVPGRTEAEVAAELDALIRQEHSAVDFVIVGSGPNGANPHHRWSDRVLNEGEPVVVDLGGTYGVGYHSDCTRTYVVGGDTAHTPEDVLAAYAVLERAQAAAREHARPGVTAGSVDAAARQVLEDAGYGEWYIHRTGHGIGLSVHEEPFIMAGNDLVLEEGMVFSIEPGIYKPEAWGMRLEDIVVTTADGIRSLNQGPRELR